MNDNVSTAQAVLEAITTANHIRFLRSSSDLNPKHAKVVGKQK